MAELPPFRALLKSTEVEDPVNIVVHRPLAYAFVWSIFRTPVTPNMVTLMSVIAGFLAGVMFVWGVPQAMIAGGVLLWSAAILDGADGFLARAKNMQSQFGRAIDGWADGVVAICTVFPAFYHIWVTRQNPFDLWLMGPAVLLTLVHMVVYDFYKENYLRATRLDKGGEAEEIEQVESLLTDAKAQGFWSHFAMKHALLPRLRQQDLFARLCDPGALRGRTLYRGNPETSEIYRKYNQGPMRLWALISLAPHSYLMAICAMANHLEFYLYIRVFLMNAIFAAALIWQRRATEQTNRELADLQPEEELQAVHPLAA